MRKTKYVIKGVWDDQVCYYVGIDKEKTFWRDLSEFSNDYLFSYLKGQI